MAVKFRFKGHESFILRDGWLTKGLVAVKEDPFVFTKNKGADALGVGTNMANSIKYWLTTGELIKSVPSAGFQLTPLGELIYENDRYFEDIFSLWLFHIHTVRNLAMATTWNVFFNDFDASTFSRKTFLRTMIEKCYEATSAESLPEASIENDCSCILAMYSDGREDVGDPEDKKISPFSVLGLLAQDKNSYEKKRPSLENVDDLLILYTIADRFDGDHLTIDEIVSGPNMPGRLFNLSRLSINDALDRLADKGYLTVNRTAGLDMVYKKEQLDPFEIVRKHYSV